MVISTTIEADHFRDKRVLERKKAAIIEKVSKGKSDEKELQEVGEEIANFVELHPLRLYTDDVTTEKLTSILADNGGVAGLVSAEGGIFDLLAGIYSKNVNIDVFLKAHAGDSLRVDRIGRSSETIQHPALTVLLAVQPSVLSGMMQNNTFRGRGLTARFLYCMPTSKVGSRKYRSESIPAEVATTYEFVIRDLLEEEAREAPQIIPLSAEADKLLEEFANELEPKLREEYSDISDWVGKLTGAVLRISALLCRSSVMVSNPFEIDSADLMVSGETMANAIRIGRYYLEHARAAYSLMGADPAVKRNEGEVPQYYVAESHPAIIDPEEWRKVQAEIARRTQYDHKSACASPFSCKIICGDCGAVYGSKVWHSRNQYRRVIWQCNSKYEGEQKCSTPHLTEDQIKGAFARAIGQLLTDRARIIGDLEAVKQGLCEETDLIGKQKNLLAEMEVLENLMHKAVMENAETAQDQEEYSKRYEAYAAKHEKLKKQYGDAQAEREARQNKAQILDSMIDSLIGAAVLTEFDR